MWPRVQSEGRRFRWVTEPSGRHQSPREITLNIEPVHALLGQASQRYRQVLAHSASAQAYLIGRTVRPETAHRFGIGYAPPAWRDLGPLLQGFPQDVVDASGLVVRAADGRTPGFNRFRDRLMFPIRTTAGQVAGFGARSLEDGSENGRHQAKYINSPEGPSFQKRHLVYGLYEAQGAIGRQGHAVVMEGYLDVVLAQQAGIATAVGSLGTSLTTPQVEQLLGLAPRLVLCFDGDEAGQRAGERALQLLAPLLTEGRQFDFVMLPAGQDPASLVAYGVDGVAALKDRIAQPLSFEVYVTQWAMAGCDLAIAEGRARCAARLGEIWRLMPPSPTRAKLSGIGGFLLGQPEDLVLGLWKR